MYQAPNECPTCHSALSITELSCGSCGTRIQGAWRTDPFSQMSPDQQAFLILFVRSRGNLSEVERALGVSYPTVRAKLEEVIRALSEEETTGERGAESADSGRRELLERVARGEVSAADAVAELRRRNLEE